MPFRVSTIKTRRSKARALCNIVRARYSIPLPLGKRSRAGIKSESRVLRSGPNLGLQSSVVHAQGSLPERVTTLSLLASSFSSFPLLPSNCYEASALAAYPLPPRECQGRVGPCFPLLFQTPGLVRAVIKASVIWITLLPQKAHSRPAPPSDLLFFRLLPRMYFGVPPARPHIKGVVPDSHFGWYCPCYPDTAGQEGSRDRLKSPGLCIEQARTGGVPLAPRIRAGLESTSSRVVRKHRDPGP